MEEGNNAMMARPSRNGCDWESGHDAILSESTVQNSLAGPNRKSENGTVHLQEHANRAHRLQSSQSITKKT